VSCPGEPTWSVYVDGELDADETRAAELHLVSCRDCRSRVLALHDEAAALRDVLGERAAAAGPVRARPGPARDLAWGLPAAVAGVTALLAVLSLLFELRLPGVLDRFDPRRLMGVYEMAFDLVFLLRSRLPGLFQLATAIGAVTALSALGCAAVHALSQRVVRSSSLLLVLVALVGVVAPDVSRALDFRRDRDTHITAGQTVSETLVCTGDVVLVDGTVDGDLLVGAERFVLSGEVTGNLYVFAEEVEIEGVVQGSALLAAERARLAGRVGGSLVFAGKRLALAQAARVARDAAVFAEGVRVEGELARDLTFAGEWVEVRGRIGRDLHVLSAERITLLDGARIGGDVRARLGRGSEAVDRAPGAVVAGETRVEARSTVRDHFLAHYRHPRFYLWLLVSAAAAFVFGLLIQVLDPRLFEAERPDARGFFRSLGVGFLLVLAGPVAIGLAALTVVGIPVALLGFFVLVTAVYSAYVFAAALVGRSLLPPSRPGLAGSAPSLLVGVLVLSAVAVLPFVGPAVRVVAVLFGLGCLFERVRALRALSLRGRRA